MTSELDATTHSRFVNEMLIGAGVMAKASTHISRGSAARMAELKGVSEDQIRRLGHWQAGAMEKHYLVYYLVYSSLHCQEKE